MFRLPPSHELKNVSAVTLKTCVDNDSLLVVVTVFLLLNYTLFLIGGIKTEFMGEQRVVVGCPLHSRACLSACSELVR